MLRQSCVHELWSLLWGSGFPTTGLALSLVLLIDRSAIMVNDICLMVIELL